VSDLVVGVLAVLIGGLLCFRGYAALRVIIAAWGAFAGFFLGAGVVARVVGESFLGSLLGWAVALVVAAVFGLLAYLYYAISVVIGMGAIGFALGTTVMVALGVTWSWAIVTAGVVAAVALAALAIAGDLPLVILAVLGALAGASVAITGLLLLVGTLGREDLAETATSATLELDWWWTAAYLLLAVAGLAAQLASVEVRRGSLRSTWAGADARPVAAAS
jgi:hypothetical protein